MDLNVFRDRQFWGDIGTNARNLPKNMIENLREFGSIPSRADAIAEQMFPNSARDNSPKNAFRHALGTGMMTQKLGGGRLASTAAKGLGYGWEAAGFWDKDGRQRIRDNWRSGDTFHDLNANAVGARIAMETRNQQELIDALARMGQQSVKRDPPRFFERSPGYLTHTVR